VGKRSIPLRESLGRSARILFLGQGLDDADDTVLDILRPWRLRHVPADEGTDDDSENRGSALSQKLRR
jgi:hypothetical protein